VPDVLPRLRLDLTALDHNIALLADWCREQRVVLAPHVKTTMTRPIVERQLAAGAWGVTVATVAQAAIVRDWGIDRIIVANEVVQPVELARLRSWLENDAALDLCCLVDSVAGVEIAARAFDGAARPLPVLVDVGTPGGRTGVRTPEEALDVARACVASTGLALVGVSGYEGVRPNTRDTPTVALVDEHCRTTVDVLDRLRPLLETSRPILTLGGSAFPDRALLAAAAADGLDGVEVVVRSGCYVTHDHGTYAEVSPFPGLRPALSVRTVVLSTPEPGLAVLAGGKRELPHDAGLPVLLSSADGVRGTAVRVYDHHLVLEEARGLAVGDVVDLGISHPCSAFDRWPEITVVDATGAAITTWHPRFH
jgi:D-serine deaminase-like pyridoxal phosphate-dependent protein